jgi:hypothetical protein
MNDELENQPRGATTPPLTTILVPTDTVLIPVAAVVLGLSPKAIRRKIEEGTWLEGREYYRRDGRVWIDLRGVERWVRGERRDVA